MTLTTHNAFSRRGRVYVHRDAADFAYSDGVSAEAYLKTVLENAGDLSSVSVELEAAIQDWPTEYHLSSKRANLLRGFDLAGCGKVLELGCGCGAITRFLGEQGASVDAVEGSPVRAELAALRCRDLDNVSVYAANFNDITLPGQTYDLICLVGVAEYAARFMASSAADGEPVLAMLDHVARALKPDGTIAIAIENRTGMKYVMGAHEDHYAKRFVGVNNYFGVKDINTYTLPEWERVFDELDVKDRKVYLPFPDYKLPTTILAREFTVGNPDAFCHLEGVWSRDYVDLYLPAVRESLLWQSAAASDSLHLYANSFLFVLSPCGPIRRKYAFDFAQLPGFSRRREYCLRTVKAEGDPMVRRSRLVPGGEAGEGVHQRVIDEPYRAGTLLSVLWSRALELEPESGRFLDLVKEYVRYLEQRAAISIDLTPSNIVVDAAGAYQAFDEEWRVEEELDNGFLLFRSLLVLALTADLSLRPYAKRNALVTVRDFVVHVGARAGLEISERLPAYVEREEAFQRRIAVSRSGNPTLELLDKSIEEDPHHRVPIRQGLYWRRAEQSYSEERSRHVLVDSSDERQTVVFMLPPAARDAEWLRFAACETPRDDGVGFMRIHRVAVATVSGESGDRTPVWRMTDPDEALEDERMTGLRHAASMLGKVFMVTDDNPMVEFSFIPRIPLPEDQYLEVALELSIPRSAEYLLARDRYLTTRERLEERLRQVDVLQASHRRMENELADIKSSNFWTALERYRALRGRTDAAADKLRLWRDIYRNIGLKRTLGRLYQRGAKRWTQARGRRPEVVGPPTRYEEWRLKHMARETRPVTEGPLISVIMPVHNVDGRVLTKAIRSVARQLYRNWELCIADDASDNPETRTVLAGLKDARIKTTRLGENLNISGATNAAAALAEGEYLAFMDNDDELPEDALSGVAAAIAARDAELVYTDEDFIRLDGHLDLPHFKPDYNPDLLLSHNYITHLLVMKRELFERIGGLRSAFDGAQDYDLVLRAVEQARGIAHVPRPLYHWRMSQTSTSLSPTVKPGSHANARQALEAALERRGIAGTVEETRLAHFFRVRRTVHGTPRVSILIPFRDKPELLRQCITSVLETSTWSELEIVGLSNDSRISTTFDEMERLAGLDRRIRFHELNIEFNFSRIINEGVARAAGEHVLLLNNDIEIITPDWIEALLEHSQRPEVAAVGGKLYYPDNTIQHAGIAIGLGGYAGHLHGGFRADAPGYFNRLNLVQNISAVTGAMMMVEKRKYDEIGGFDEARFGIAYNDVDFCLRAREAGYLNVFTPFAEAYHHESASRGYEDTQAKQTRFAAEKANLLERHGEALAAGDPYYNPNLDPGRDDFRFFVEPVKTAKR